MRAKRSATAAVAAAIGAVAAVAVVQAPAWASTTSCEFSYDEAGCWTGAISANPTYHAIYVAASAYSADAIRCYVYDNSTWIIVGDLRSTKHTVSKIIRGLYGTYVMDCVQDSGNHGSGEGELHNDDFWVR